jgi:hypothetical protein
MKKLSIIMVCLVAAAFTACNDILDINENPNLPTSVKPELILPQALTATANVMNQYNSYGSQIGGYAANAGGYGGFNELVSYAYTPNNYANLWTSTYDNLEDYQYIINNTETDSLNSYYFAAAKIMKAFNFQMLVDTYNDVPYSEALQGQKFLTPKYDAAASVYTGIAAELDEAIAAIHEAQALPVINEMGDNDIVFGGDMDKWLQLANTIKLRLMIRANGKTTFNDTSFDPVGFLDEDALINPGFTRDNNRQNPLWNTWAFAYTGSAGLKSWIPTTFILSFYNGYNISDPARGHAIFYQYPSTGTNQLGYEGTGIAKSPDGSFWFPGKLRDGKSAGDTTGVMKGPDAGYPLFTAAESYFLQAEAVVEGLSGVSGTAKDLFQAGKEASFNYIFELPDGSLATDTATNKPIDPAAFVVQYDTINKTNRLVNFDLATTTDQQIEAIITQKYIALNMVNSAEGWNEFRRTGYPKVSGTSASTTFASYASQAQRSDKLPTRILYPVSEIQYNSENVPAGSTNSFTSLIFWAK